MRQIDENGQIQQSEHHLEHGDVADDLVELPGQEGAGQDQGELFGPDLFQTQAGAVDDVQGGVEKNGEAYLFEPVGA